MYEWQQPSIPHSARDVAAGQYFAKFLVAEGWFNNTTIFHFDIDFMLMLQQGKASTVSPPPLKRINI